MSTRDRSFRLPMSEEEFAKLHQVAHAERVSATELVRALVNARYAKHFGDKKPLPVKERSEV